MIHTDRRLRLCSILLALNLAFIWGNSLLPGSVSGAFSDWVKGLLAALFPMEGPETSGSGLLRKIAHFSEFALLGMLLTWRCGMLGKKRHSALIFGVAAACVDETIQRFVPDRGPSLFDVGIDVCGVITGMLALTAAHTILTKKKVNQPVEELL